MSKYLLAGAAVTALVGAAAFGAPYVSAQAAQYRYGTGEGDMTQSRQHVHATDGTQDQLRDQQQLRDQTECDGTGPKDGTGLQHGYGQQREDNS